VHAEGAARGKRERDLLGVALQSREAARRGKRSAKSLEFWRPLVDARWTLVDTYESDGARYIVARENRTAPFSLGALTERERQVVACLTFGQSTKEIAYGLGIGASTVRVLLQRAAEKLAVSGRKGLLDHPAVKAMRGGLGATEIEELRAAEGSHR
jgi:DNA-binding CsgD family transcriptional regulator